MSQTLTLEAMRSTAVALAPHIFTTPVAPLGGPTLDRLLDPSTHVLMKLELFQKTGTFKARGALNVAMQLTPDQRKRGITAVSAGNHAIAAAFAAKAIGVSAKVVVQDNANPQRLAVARSYGADIVLAAAGAAAFAEMERIVAEEGRAMIHPFEGIYTSLGTATLGLELAAQAPELDAVVVAIGGGGLASGVSAAIKAVLPHCQVYGVEPEGANVMNMSFANGEPMRMPHPPSTIADSLAPPMTLPVAYGLCREHLDDLVTVSDDEICRAMAVQFLDGKLAVEPAGATALAAVLGPLRERLKGKRVGIIICGANIDSTTFGRLLARGEQALA